MARKRFSDLEQVYDALKQAKVDISTLPQKLSYAKFAKWKEGETTRVIADRPSLGASVQLGVIAFGLGHTDADAKILLTSNTRAKSQINAVSGLKTALGVEDTTFTGYSEEGGFIPATMRFALILGSATPANSDITGKPYKKRTGSAYTAPVGQGASARGYKEAINELLALSALTGNYKVSFKPEEWRRD